MSFEIRETPRPGIWEVVYHGEIDLETRLLAFEAGRGVLESRLARGILVDFREAELTISQEEAYDLARERTADFLLIGVRMAMLFDRIPPEIDFDILVAKNRCLCFRAFCDQNQALSWLEGADEC